MLIRKSSDGGSTWTTIVDYENVATKGSIGKGTVRRMIMIIYIQLDMVMMPPTNSLGS